MGVTVVETTKIGLAKKAVDDIKGIVANALDDLIPEGFDWNETDDMDVELTKVANELLDATFCDCDEEDEKWSDA